LSHVGKAENLDVYKVPQAFSHVAYPNQLLLNAKCTRSAVDEMYKEKRKILRKFIRMVQSKKKL